MKFADMFTDDSTKQLSLGRVLCATILVFQLLCAGHMMATKGVLLDLASNWMLTALGLYGINKASGTTANILGAK